MAGGGPEELIEVEIPGEEGEEEKEGETLAFAVHCQPVLETVSNQQAPGEEEEEGEDDGW